jgi:hypothetical protein
MSGFTLSCESVSGIDAEAMSGGLAVAAFEGAGSASDLCLTSRVFKAFATEQQKE